MGPAMTLEKAIALHDKLVAADPLHASPAEHQCQADKFGDPNDWHDGFDGWEHPEEHGNLVGFRQYRKQLPGESK